MFHSVGVENKAVNFSIVCNFFDFEHVEMYKVKFPWAFLYCSHPIPKGRGGVFRLKRKKYQVRLHQQKEPKGNCTNY